ncbi:hypothetical protein [Streptomyces sp. NPDC090994]|uniref:hypothetical protein n=1 Tax=Streptomyces sp. NPDC090994 TaxID=3365969 RepID=UPI00380BF67E
MAAIERIDVRIVTASNSPSGVRGWVYVNVAGREFALDSSRDEWEPGTDVTYVLGDGANIYEPERNDPRDPQLDTDDLDRYPVYLRYAPPSDKPDETWRLERVIVTVNPGGDLPARYDNLRLAGNPAIWLGRNSGQVVNLRRV